MAFASILQVVPNLPLDSGTVIYHLKVIRGDEMERWAKALKDVKARFIEASSVPVSPDEVHLFETQLKLFSIDLLNNLSMAKGLVNRLKVEVELKQASILKSSKVASVNEINLDESKFMLRLQPS
jgi:hypothetical protein